MTDKVDDFLQHFGVKGMKWGLTRQRGPSGRVSGKAKPTPLAPGEVEPVHVRVSGGRVTTSGGRGNTAHPDAVNARVTKQRIDSSGLNTVSNQDLQSYVTRVNLEQQYARLSPKTTSKGQQFASSAGVGTAKFAGNIAKDIARQTITNAVKAGIDSKLKK